MLHNNLAYCCIHRNELALAEKSLERAVQLDPNLQAAWLNRVFLEMMHTRRCPDYLPLRGIEYFQLALALGPVDGDFYHHAAVLCEAVAGRTASWSATGSWALVAARLADQEEKQPPGLGPVARGVLSPREYQDLAVSYVKEAVANGHPVVRIQQNVLLRSLLASRPELAELKGNKGRVVPRRPLHLDPLADR
jgi:hypothetical protein